MSDKLSDKDRGSSTIGPDWRQLYLPSDPVYTEVTEQLADAAADAIAAHIEQPAQGVTP